MKCCLQALRRLTVIGLAVSTLAACAVVPYGAPGYYDYPDRVYGPPAVVPVPVPLPYYYPRHHWRHGHRGYR